MSAHTRTKANQTTNRNKKQRMQEIHPKHNNFNKIQGFDKTMQNTRNPSIYVF
jgi:hypothetical protein